MHSGSGVRQRRAALKAIASYLPAGSLSNEELAEELGGWDARKILEKTGIAVRRIAARDECSSDLGVAAAQRLFEKGACAPAEIDFLLFCTQSPDYFLPTTACLVQDRLGLRLDCGALDFNQGCSGFVYGLSLAKSLIETGNADKVLLITAETYSKFVNPRDRSVRTIFGDGAAATLLTAVESERELIGPFVFGTDGRGARELIVPAGGMRQPVGCEQAVETEDGRGNWRSARNLYMNGPEVYRFTIETVPKLLEQLLDKSGRRVEDVDHFIFHQANKFMLERLRARTPHSGGEILGRYGGMRQYGFLHYPHCTGDGGLPQKDPAGTPACPRRLWRRLFLGRSHDGVGWELTDLTRSWVMPITDWSV